MEMTDTVKQFKGLNKDGVTRCRTCFGLNAHKYCNNHVQQGPQTAQCEAIDPDTERRCLQFDGVNAEGFCREHDPTRCKGFLLPPDENKRCENAAKSGYAYCCSTHDPTLPHFNIERLDRRDLRDTMEGPVVMQYRDRDPYNGNQLGRTTTRSHELDHIVKKQCFAHGLNQLPLDYVDIVVPVLNEKIVHELDNLALTLTATNRIKGQAVYKFQGDLVTGHLNGRTFTEYLHNERRQGERLDRDVTRRITRAMGKSMKNCQRKLADEGESPELEAMSAQLQQLYVDMELAPSSLR